MKTLSVKKIKVDEKGNYILDKKGNFILEDSELKIRMPKLDKEGNVVKDKKGNPVFIRKKILFSNSNIETDEESISLVGATSPISPPPPAPESLDEEENEEEDEEEETTNDTENKANKNGDISTLEKLQLQVAELKKKLNIEKPIPKSDKKEKNKKEPSVYSSHGFDTRTQKVW